VINDFLVVKIGILNRICIYKELVVIGVHSTSGTLFKILVMEK